jgi:hypothetical protein
LTFHNLHSRDIASIKEGIEDPEVLGKAAQRVCEDLEKIISEENNEFQIWDSNARSIALQVIEFTNYLS